MTRINRLHPFDMPCQFCGERMMPEDYEGFVYLDRGCHLDVDMVYYCPRCNLSFPVRMRGTVESCDVNPDSDDEITVAFSGGKKPAQRAAKPQSRKAPTKRKTAAKRKTGARR